LNKTSNASTAGNRNFDKFRVTQEWLGRFGPSLVSGAFLPTLFDRSGDPDEKTICT
jgi:hypothetical protein